MISNEIRSLLDTKAALYNNLDFIDTDPIQIPHRFSKKQDIEIAGLFAATIAWGQRKTIINNGKKLMDWMDNDPYDFICNHTSSDLKKMVGFKHRTFNSEDLFFFIERLQWIYTHYESMEELFHEGVHANDINMANSIDHFRTSFLGEDITRTAKHVSSPAKGSASKRLVMFLRWMIRQDNNGVDFGVWKSISPSLLSCPLDVHSGNVARELRLLTRTQNDWKAVLELDLSLRKLDPMDPAKYDFALFGIGAFESI